MTARLSMAEGIKSSPFPHIISEGVSDGFTNMALLILSLTHCDILLGAFILSLWKFSENDFWQWTNPLIQCLPLSSSFGWMYTNWTGQSLDCIKEKSCFGQFLLSLTVTTWVHSSSGQYLTPKQGADCKTHCSLQSFEH